MQLDLTVNSPEPVRFVQKLNSHIQALYRIAAEQGGHALCVLTVSDQIMKGEKMSAVDRETSFVEMMQITLDSLL